MADDDRMSAPPREEILLIDFTRKIAAGAVAEMGLARTVHRMIARIDARHGGNRAELAECRVGNVAVVDDVGIVGERNFEQSSPRADLGIGAEAAVAHLGGGMYQRLGRKSFRAHERCMRCRPLCLHDADDTTMTAEREPPASCAEHRAGRCCGIAVALSPFSATAGASSSTCHLNVMAGGFIGRSE